MDVNKSPAGGTAFFFRCRIYLRGLLNWMLFEIRRSMIPAEVRILVRIVPLIGITAIGSLVIIYATGAYLTESLHPWEFALPVLVNSDVLSSVGDSTEQARDIQNVNRRVRQITSVPGKE